MFWEESRVYGGNKRNKKSWEIKVYSGDYVESKKWGEKIMGNSIPNPVSKISRFNKKV